MTLADFASLSTAISGIAVTASLIYLALQVHQNTKHTRALIHQGRAARVVDHQMAMADADITATAIIGNGGEPTSEEVKRRQFRAVCQTYLFSYDDSFSQYRIGLLEMDAYLTLRRNIGSHFSQMGYRADWERTKVPGTEFTKFVDEIISKLPTATSPATPTQ